MADFNPDNLNVTINQTTSVPRHSTLELLEHFWVNAIYTSGGKQKEALDKEIIVLEDWFMLHRNGNRRIEKQTLWA